MTPSDTAGQLQLHLEQFLVYLTQEESYARNTVAAYRNDLSQLIEFLGRQEPPIDNWSQVTPSVLTSFVDSLRVMKVVKRHGEEKPVAPSTIARKVAALKSFFNYLTMKGVVPSDPSLELEAPKVAKRTPKTMTDEEVEKLLAAPGTGNSPKALRDRALLELLYATGMRVSELVALKTEDVHLAERVVWVRSEDGSKQRAVPIGDKVVEAMQAYLERGRPHFLKNAGGQSALFLNQRGQQLTRQDVVDY